MSNTKYEPILYPEISDDAILRVNGEDLKGLYEKFEFEPGVQKKSETTTLDSPYPQYINVKTEQGKLNVIMKYLSENDPHYDLLKQSEGNNDSFSFEIVESNCKRCFLGSVINFVESDNRGVKIKIQIISKLEKVVIQK